MRSFGLAVLVWVGLGFLSLIALDLLILPFFSGQYKDIVEVPSLIGKKPEECVALLQGKGLTIMVDSMAESSAEVRKGRVCRQRPIAGSEVKEGRRIWITLSKGKKTQTVPDFFGQSKRQVEITLQQMSLLLGNIITSPAPGVPQGVVFHTDPERGSLIHTGSKIDVYVSSGELPSVESLPNFVGLSIQKAKLEAAKLNLAIEKIDSVFSADLLPGTVAEQKPMAGTAMTDSMSIVLTITTLKAKH